MNFKPIALERLQPEKFKMAVLCMYYAPISDP